MLSFCKLICKFDVDYISDNFMDYLQPKNEIVIEGRGNEHRS